MNASNQSAHHGEKTSPRDCLLPLQPYLPGRSAEDVAKKFSPSRISKMGSNENPLGPGRKAIEAVKAHAENLSVYPDAACLELRAALAASTEKKIGNICVGNGSDEVLMLIAAAYLNPGDEVLISSHTFFNYEFVSRVFDGIIRVIPTSLFAYDLPGFAAAAGARTKLIFLCNPNNPTGLYFSHSELASLLTSLPRHVLVVIDEAYVEYADAADFPDTQALMEIFPNLIVTRTFSKAHGLAALRVGYALASESIIADLHRAKMPFNANGLAQKAAVAALGDKEHLQKTLAMNREGKRVLAPALENLGCKVLASQANFLCFLPPRSASEVCEYLFEQGVIVRPLNRFGLDRWIRVTIGTPEQNAHFVEALTALIGLGAGARALTALSPSARTLSAATLLEITAEQSAFAKS